MKIIDICGDPVEACMQFDYKGYLISVSTIFNKRGKIVIFGPNDEVFEGRAETIPLAMQFIDSICGST